MVMQRTPSPDTIPERGSGNAPLVDAAWSREWGCWVVSSIYRGHWTLVGLFESSAPAFRAARRASESFREDTAQAGCG